MQGGDHFLYASVKKEKHNIVDIVFNCIGFFTAQLFILLPRTLVNTFVR